MLPIIRFYVLFLLAGGVGISLHPVLARRADYTIEHLLYFWMIVFSAAVVLLPFVRRLPTRRSFAVTIAAQGGALVCLSQVSEGLAWYLATAVCLGPTLVFFWVVYLTRHVDAGPERANAFNSSVIVALQFGTACVAPLLSGVLIERFGIRGAITGGAVFLAIAATQIHRILPGDVPVRLRHAWGALAPPVRLLLLFQGSIEAMQFGLLTICTTAYLTEPLMFAGFVSMLAFVGSATNLLISRWSDRVGNRSRVIYLGCAVMAVGAVILATATDVRQWSVGAALTTCGFTVTLPYFMAVILDAAPSVADAFVAREWTCNTGRLISLAIALAFVRLAGNAQYAYFWSLIPLAGYPAVLYLAGRRGQLTVAAAPPVGVTADAEAEILVP